MGTALQCLACPSEAETKHLSQNQIWLGSLSNRVDYILIHRNLTNSLKELRYIGLKGAEKAQKKMKGFWTFKLLQAGSKARKDTQLKA